MQIPATKPQWVSTQESPSGIGSSKAFAAPTVPQKAMPAADAPTTAAPTQNQTPPCVSDEIP